MRTRVKGGMIEMHSSSLIKLTTGTLALLLTGSVGFGIHQVNSAEQTSKQAQSWRAEAEGWQSVAQASARHDNQVAAENRALVRKYNQLVVDTQAQERQLVSVARQAQAVAGATAGSTAAGSAQAPVEQAAAPTQSAPPAAQPAAPAQAAPPAAQPAPAQVPQSSAS